MVQCVKYAFNFSECELLKPLRLIASTNFSHVLHVVVMSSQDFCIEYNEPVKPRQEGLQCGGRGSSSIENM